MPSDFSGLARFRAGIGAALEAAVVEVAKQVEATAQSLVPVDTGALRTSIETFGAAGEAERIVSAGQGLDYAAHIEFGTYKMAAQPFMTPAAQRADLKGAVTEELRALAGRSRV